MNFSPTLKSFSLLTVLICVLPTLDAKSTGNDRATAHDAKGGIWKRALDEHGHELDEHGHEDEHAEGEASSCLVTDHVLAHEFSELAEEMSLTDADGDVCVVEEEGEHGHEEEYNKTSQGHNETSDPHSGVNLTCSSCDVVYDFVQTLLLRLNVTTPCCLGNESACEQHEGDGEPSSRSRTDPAKAYGYGFLMVVVISAMSLLGVFLVPLLNKNNKFHHLYKYFYALMIALGTSALFCDAILHLIPEAFGLHEHGAGEEGHAHEEEGEEEDKTFIWRGIIVIAGLYLFYLFEVTLHSWNEHSHQHHGSYGEEEESNSGIDCQPIHNESQSHSGTMPLTSKPSSPTALDNPCREPTLPHGPCRDKPAEESRRGSILHPRRSSCSCEDQPISKPASKETKGKKCLPAKFRLKPLAWVIILGDAIHNFADGLALGAAISQSLSLGVSTMIAIVFHELPHELGDFAILLSTGLSWYVTLLLNFVSSLTAVVGFFVGVAVGIASSEANGWILAAAAGVFLYIALVDLLPELIHVREKGWVRLLLIVMANIGFFISFAVLLLIAVYEEELNTLITV